MSVVTRTRCPRFDAQPDLLDQVVDLALGRPHLDDRIEQPRRPDDLFHDLAGMLALVECRRGADVDRLRDVVVKLLKGQRPVVKRAGQAEAIVDQHFLARPVAVVHAAHLRQRHVALVHDQQPVGREVVEQRPRRAARRAAGQGAAVVLDAVAVAHLAQHLDVIVGALADALGFQQLALRLKEGHLLIQLFLDLLDGNIHPVGRRHEVLGRVDVHLVVVGQHLAGQRVNFGDAFDLVAPEADAVGGFFLRRLDLQHIAAHAEAAALQNVVVAVVVDLHQVAQDVVAPHHLAHGQPQHYAAVVLGAAEAVNAGDRGHDHNVAAAEQCARRRQAQAVDLLVDLHLLLDVGVRARNVCFRLVVVVVGDEVLDGVVGQELAHFGIELRGQRFVMRQDQRRLLHLFHDLGHGKGLAAAGHAEQHLLAHTLAHTLRELGDRLWLISRRLELTDNLNRRHGPPCGTAVTALSKGTKRVTEQRFYLYSIVHFVPNVQHFWPFLDMELMREMPPGRGT